MTLVKICGIRTVEEARIAVEAGAWGIGEVFAPSKRRITPEQARAINNKLTDGIMKIGVFVNEELSIIHEIIKHCRLDAVQLHGDEAPELIGKIPIPVIKSFSITRPLEPDLYNQWRPWAFHFDSGSQGEIRGGTGKTFNWDYLVIKDPGFKLILSGGLNPENVGSAIARVRPWAVDVSSGVEYAGGGKNPHAIMDFMNRVRAVDAELRQEDMGSKLR